MSGLQPRGSQRADTRPRPTPSWPPPERPSSAVAWGSDTITTRIGPVFKEERRNISTMIATCWSRMGEVSCATREVKVCGEKITVFLNTCTIYFTQRQFPGKIITID